MTVTSVHTPKGLYRLDEVARALGLPDAPPVPQQGAPSLWLGGRLHDDVCRYLEHRHRTTRSHHGVRASAYAIGSWVGWLHTRGLSVRAATAEDWRVYEVHRRWPPDGSEGIRDDSWRQHADHINRFHVWLEDDDDVPSPVPVEIKYGPYGPVRGVAHAGGRLAKSSDDVIPLMPAELRALRSATMARTPTGREPLHGQRDQAIVSWMFATGNRVRAATFSTVYEVPVPSAGRVAFVDHRTAAQVNKFKRPLQARAFSGGLKHVQRYIRGERAATAAGHTHTPDRPLHLVSADTRRVVYERDDQRVTVKWDHVTDEQRTRLVCPDGSSVASDEVVRDQVDRRDDRLLAGDAAHLGPTGRHRRRAPAPHHDRRGRQDQGAGARGRGAAARQRDPPQSVGVFRGGGARPPVEVTVAFIDEHRQVHGVEPICRALQFAPSTYDHRKKRQGSRSAAAPPPCG